MIMILLLFHLLISLIFNKQSTLHPNEHYIARVFHTIRTSDKQTFITPNEHEFFK